MRLRVKQEQTAYVHNRRYRSGQIVDVPEKMLRKADKAYIETLEKQRAKELGAEQAAKHGLKVGSLVLPKWAELPNKPIAAVPAMPGVAAGSGAAKSAGQQPPEGPEPEAESEAGAEDEGAGGGSQNVL